MAAVPSLTFGALLKRYRIAAGLTQEELAAQSGLSPRGISDLERGERRVPRKETIELLAGALRLSSAERSALEAAARQRAVPPPPITTQRAATTPSQVQRERVPLVGRVGELRLVERQLADGPPLLLVVGEPGMGKSRLLQAGREQAEARGWAVLAGGCHRKSGQEPYAPFLGALTDSLQHQMPAQQRRVLDGCAWLVRLLPELMEQVGLPAPTWTLPPEQERRLMFRAVTRYLTNVAGPAGTLLVLDDLHWAGPDALDLLHFLVISIPERPLRLLGAYRDTEVSAQEPLAVLVADLARQGQAMRTKLAPLSAEEATDLLATLLPESAEESAQLRQHVLQRAGGLPFFLVSCAQALRSDSSSQSSAEPSEEVPWTVAESIRQRVMSLPETAQGLLGVAAAVGRTALLSLLLVVAAQFGKGEAETLGALESCCRARLLVETEEQKYQFAHDLIREVVWADLGIARRSLLHRRIAEALEQRAGGAPPEVLAYHFAQSGDTEKVILYLEQAGDAARASYAHAEAVEAYQQVVARLDTIGRSEQAALLREKLGEVLVLLGRYEEALAILEQAVEDYHQAREKDGELRALAKLGMTYRWRGTAEEGLKRLHTTINRLPALGDSPGAAAFLVALAQLYVGIDHYQEMLTAAEQAVRIAATLGDTKTLLLAQERRGSALSLLGKLREAHQVLTEEVIAKAEALGDLTTLINALSGVSVLYAEWGDFLREQHYIEQALKVAERLGEPRNLVFLAHRLGIIAFALGEWTRARTKFEQATTWARERGRFLGKTYAFYGLGLLSLAEGEEEAAFRCFEEAQRFEQSQHHRVLHWMQWALAERDLLGGHPEAARARLAPLLHLPSRKTGYIMEFLPLLALASLEIGERAEAQSLLGQLITEAREAELRPALAEALRVQALACVKEERWEEAEQALREAVALFHTMPYPYAEAKTLYVFGHMYLQQGAPDLAREHFLNAQAILGTLGEKLYASRIEQALAAL